jgi:hypothetical protein
MAAAELSGATTGPAAGQRCVVLHVYLTLWAITLAGAGLTALLARAGVHMSMGLSLSASANPPPSPGRVLALAAHNLPICAWPLLLGLLKLGGGSRWRRVADIVVLACAVANVLPVAAALGGYGGLLLPYVPQLPLEWAALAVGYGSWIVERDHGLAGSDRLKLLGVLSVLLLAAGVLETFAVPHR